MSNHRNPQNHSPKTTGFYRFLPENRISRPQQGRQRKETMTYARLRNQVDTLMRKYDTELSVYRARPPCP